MMNYFRTPNDNKKGWLGLKGKSLSRDKQKHIVCGLAVFLSLVFFVGVETSAAIVVAVAFGKELFDAVRGGVKSFSMADLIATILIPVVIQLVSLYLI